MQDYSFTQKTKNMKKTPNRYRAYLIYLNILLAIQFLGALFLTLTSFSLFSSNGFFGNLLSLLPFYLAIALSVFILNGFKRVLVDLDATVKRQQMIIRQLTVMERQTEEALRLPQEYT